MENEQLIRHFYESFARNDADAMVACYSDEIEFHDPAFGLLKGADAKNMWRMLSERAKGNIKIEFKNITADDKKGSADWTADYLFSKTGRKVFNEIHAEFETRRGPDFPNRATAGVSESGPFSAFPCFNRWIIVDGAGLVL